MSLTPKLNFNAGSTTTGGTFDFSAESHIKKLPTEGWHHAVIQPARVTEKNDATWASISLTLDSGHKVDDVCCIDAEPGGMFASRVPGGRRRIAKYLEAGDRTTKISGARELEEVLDEAEVEVYIRWRNPDFPVPFVTDVRKPEVRPLDSESRNLARTQAT